MLVEQTQALEQVAVAVVPAKHQLVAQVVVTVVTAPQVISLVQQ